MQIELEPKQHQTTITESSLKERYNLSPIEKHIYYSNTKSYVHDIQPSVTNFNQLQSLPYSFNLLIF